MNIPVPTFVLTSLALGAICLPTSALRASSGPSRPEAAVLRAAQDPALEALCAGGASTRPAPVTASERATLAAAERASPELAAHVAGFRPTDDQWGFIAIGAAVVLVLILL